MAFTPQVTASAGSRKLLWLIPAVPMLAAGVHRAAEAAAEKAVQRGWRSGRSVFSLLVALAAFGHVLSWVVARRMQFARQ